MFWSKTIFAVYFLVLACLPCFCSDRAEGPADACESSAAHNNDHPCDANENCTPFCVCASCATVCNPPVNKPDLKTIFVTIEVNYRGELPANYDSASKGSIWQPPRWV